MFEFLRLGSRSIGIIGGADGPTAIFVSGRPSAWYWLIPLLLGLIALLGLWIWKKRKHTKE